MCFSLSELLAILGEVVDKLFPSLVWVTAEIADLRCDQSGHCYLELVEKRDGELKARVRGTIWASVYPAILASFTALTGQPLQRGMEILAFARVRFHPVYGLSLDIRDIDPRYSLGAMMRHRKEVLLRLAQEGVLERNHRLPFPPVPQRIAVLSSPYAAGFEDFMTHLVENPHGFRFFVELFPIFVQGEDVEASILSALQEVEKRLTDFDVLVILRGGGAQSDLHWFDSYTLGRAIATFPLPVLVGIGHQRDETVLDVVAHSSLKTPTAVADFLVERMWAFDSALLRTMEALQAILEDILGKQRRELSALFETFERATQFLLHRTLERVTWLSLSVQTHTERILERNRTELERTWEAHGTALYRILEVHAASLERAIQAIELLDPQNILKRGYTLTLKDGKIVHHAGDCHVGDTIETWFVDGRVTSEVTRRHVPSGPHLSASL